MKKGITLVALVVTIIILLILATVTISLILGDNSLFGRAAEGKTKTELAQVGERLQNAATAMLLDIQADPTKRPTSLAAARSMLADNVSVADTDKLATPPTAATLDAGEADPSSGTPNTVTFEYVVGDYKLVLVIDFAQTGASYSVVDVDAD